MALIGPGALGHRQAIVEHGILKGRKVSCQRERRFSGLMFRKGALFIPAVLNVWAATLYKMLRQTSGVALSGIAVARIGAALQILVHKAKQTIVGHSVAAMWRGCE